MFQQPLRGSDPGLVREANAAETQLNILESSWDKLVSIAQSVEEEAGDRNEEEPIEITDNVLYNKGCLQKMTQTWWTHRICNWPARPMGSCWMQWRQCRRVPASQKASAGIQLLAAQLRSGQHDWGVTEWPQTRVSSGIPLCVNYA